VRRLGHPGQSLEALEEAIVILRAWWSTPRVLGFHGRRYELEGARPGPKPAHPIGIWVGAAKPRALALTGRKADAWAAPLMNYPPPAQTAEAQAVIDGAALAAGRDPREIRRIYDVPRAFTARAPAPARDTDVSIVAPPDHWAAVLTHLAPDLGFDTSSCSDRRIPTCFRYSSRMSRRTFVSARSRRAGKPNPWQ
jgi:alkanesulfonate monooxygenase SsuD/methylene tetrahydromethanopterin reductase-like flavin-dependent oxidoreductase (luciferase family)